VRVAVTGAAGYLGRAIVPALARDHRVEEVVAIDVRPPRIAPPVDGAVAPVRMAIRDVRDRELRRELEGADALVHLAFRVLGRGRDAASVNVDGSRNAFTSALDAGVRTIVHASSAAAYGCAPDNPVPLTEQHPLRALPPFYYPQTKAAVERLLDELEQAHPEARFVRMRPVSTLGPGAPRVARGRVFVTVREFDPLIQFTWIDDLVEAFRAALHTETARGPYNVGAPGPVRSSQVAGLIGVRGVRLPHRVVRTLARFTMDPAWVDMTRYPIVVDTTRAESELGWHPTYDCATALRRYGKEVL
jgi:UDP-glucose 4-epimerase